MSKRSDKDSNAVGGVFIFFIILVVLFAFIVGQSEDEYKRKVASGEIEQATEIDMENYDPIEEIERIIEDLKR
jgi:hypothetical protein